MISKRFKSFLLVAAGAAFFSIWYFLIQSVDTRSSNSADTPSSDVALDDGGDG